jgi:hypothetical protein
VLTGERPVTREQALTVAGAVTTLSSADWWQLLGAREPAPAGPVTTLAPQPLEAADERCDQRHAGSEGIKRGSSQGRPSLYLEWCGLVFYSSVANRINIVATWARVAPS